MFKAIKSSAMLCQLNGNPQDNCCEKEGRFLCQNKNVNYAERKGKHRGRVQDSVIIVASSAPFVQKTAANSARAARRKP